MKRKLKPDNWIKKIRNLQLLFPLFADYRPPKDYLYITENFSNITPTYELILIIDREVAKSLGNLRQNKDTTWRAVVYRPSGDQTEKRTVRHGFKTIDQAKDWIVERSIINGYIKQLYDKRFNPLLQLADCVSDD